MTILWLFMKIWLPCITQGLLLSALRRLISIWLFVAFHADRGCGDSFRFSFVFGIVTVLAVYFLMNNMREIGFTAWLEGLICSLGFTAAVAQQSDKYQEQTGRKK